MVGNKKCIHEKKKKKSAALRAGVLGHPGETLRGGLSSPLYRDLAFTRYCFSKALL